MCAFSVPDIQLQFSLRRPVVGEDPRGMERWTITADVGEQEAVGEIQVLVVDLLRCGDPWAALDSSNDNIAHIGEVVFDMNTGQLAEALDTRLDRVGHRVLVLDRVELRPEWQGRNVAALLAAESLDQLRTGCRVALCLPGPLDLGQGTTEDEYEDAVRRMTRVWSQLGFRPFDEGVWFLDPNRRTLDASRAEIRGRHGLPSPLRA